jgi:hypothetical protein
VSLHCRIFFTPSNLNPMGQPRSRHQGRPKYHRHTIHHKPYSCKLLFDFVLEHYCV